MVIALSALRIEQAHAARLKMISFPICLVTCSEQVPQFIYQITLNPTKQNRKWTASSIFFFCFFFLFFVFAFGLKSTAVQAHSFSPRFTREYIPLPKRQGSALLFNGQTTSIWSPIVAGIWAIMFLSSTKHKNNLCRNVLSYNSCIIAQRKCCRKVLLVVMSWSVRTRLLQFMNFMCLNFWTFPQHFKQFHQYITLLYFKYNFLLMYSLQNIFFMSPLVIDLIYQLRNNCQSITNQEFWGGLVNCYFWLIVEF